MHITIYCVNCRADILRADSDTLKSPLVGSMFLVKPGMEWNIFAPTATGNDLTCPMCEWSFHRDGLLLTDQGEITPSMQVVELGADMLPVVTEDQKVDAIFEEVKKVASNRGRPKGSKNVKKKGKR